VGKEIFVDASAWIALADEDDKYHSAAKEAYPGLLRTYSRLVTTNLVVAEAHIAIRRAGGYQPAMRFLVSIRDSSKIEKVYSDSELEKEALDILERYDDQEFSFADAVSFALMKRSGIERAFTFDHDFHTMGFICVPAPPE
jgi:hypothetical protein